MIQNNNQSSNSSLNDSLDRGDSKVVLAPNAVSNKVEKTANTPQIATLLKSTNQRKWLNPNFWHDLSWRKQITLVSVALSFTSASLVGGVGYYAPNHLGLAILSSGIVIAIAGMIAKKFINEIAIPDPDPNKLEIGKSVDGEDCQLNELDSLSSNLGELSTQLEILADEQSKINQQRQLISSIAFRTRQTTNLAVLLKTAVDGAREILDTDRVVFYRINDDRSVKVIAESVTGNFPSLLNESFSDRIMVEDQMGSIKAIDDLDAEIDLTGCQMAMLRQFKVKANLVVPIRQQGKLIGLLMAHHCRDTRVWQKTDIDFCSQLATEVEYSWEYLHLIREREQTAKKAWFFGDIAFCASQTNSLEAVLATAVKGAREILQADRVCIYRFNADWGGQVVAESVASEYPSAFPQIIDDPCFREGYTDLARNNRVRAIANIRTEPDLTEYYIRTLEKYQVKAHLTVSLRQDGKLKGLLIAQNCSAPRVWQQSEIDFCSQLADRIEYAKERFSFLEKIKSTTNKARLFGDIAFRNRQEIEPSQIFSLVVNGARKVLQCDRVLLYKIDADSSGTVVTESVAENWTQLLNISLNDSYFKGRYLDLYRNVKFKAINDIARENAIADCHLRTLEQYNVKANLVVPIRQEDKLYGLLIAHNCSAPRVWQPAEIDFFCQLAIQAEYALDRINSIQQLKQEKQIAEQASLAQQQKSTAIDRQLEALVADIQDTFTGNLTVRARSADGAIGIVAKFLNNALENFQKIVLQVQSTSSVLIETVRGSEENINTLSNDASRQARSITVALRQIQAMAESIHGVADNAQSAKQMVKQANQTLEDGDRTMNRTVDGILTIKETVEEAAQKVKRLGDASQKISRVVSLIRDLANQTHVLALNASIEANGTSSEGKGFAVVAEEVRSLSEQSTAATKEIEQILEEIQTETNQVAIAMDAGREQVIAGTDLVETTRQQLTSISQVSGQIKQLVEEMAQAATAQAKTSASVFKTMQEVESIAQKTSAKSIASAKSFDKLLDVAEELKESVTQFEVN